MTTTDGGGAITSPVHIPIEILVNGKPHCMVDVPVLGEINAASQAAAERRAFWTIVASGAGEPEDITARYAPELAEVKLLEPGTPEWDAAWARIEAAQAGKPGVPGNTTTNVWD